MDFYSDILKQFGPTGLFIAFLIWEHKVCAADRAHFMSFIERQSERQSVQEDIRESKRASHVGD